MLTVTQRWKYLLSKQRDPQNPSSNHGSCQEGCCLALPVPAPSVLPEKGHISQAHRKGFLADSWALGPSAGWGSYLKGRREVTPKEPFPLFPKCNPVVGSQMSGESSSAQALWSSLREASGVPASSPAVACSSLSPFHEKPADWRDRSMGKWCSLHLKDSGGGGRIVTGSDWKNRLCIKLYDCDLVHQCTLNCVYPYVIAGEMSSA